MIYVLMTTCRSLGLKCKEEHAVASLDVRKTNHKYAEQRRRDCIKQCFEDLKGVLPNLTEKNPSKLYILQKTFEYVCDMQEKQQELERQLAEVKK